MKPKPELQGSSVLLKDQKGFVSVSLPVSIPAFTFRKQSRSRQAAPSSPTACSFVGLRGAEAAFDGEAPCGSVTGAQNHQR